MNSNYFYRKINWKHILIHAVAIWFIQYGAFQLAFLTDVGLLELYNNGGGSTISDEALYARRVSFLTAVGTASAYGKLIGFAVSLFVSIKRKWYWLNAFIAFIAVVISTNLLGFTSLPTAEFYMYFTSLVFESILYRHLVFGMFFLLIGTLLLFLAPVQRYIQSNNPAALPEKFEFENGTAISIKVEDVQEK